MSSARYPSGFSPPKKRIVSETATSRNTTLDKGKQRAIDQGDEDIKPDVAVVTNASTLKRKAAQPPAESLLHRLAGPSTGKAGLSRNPEEVRQIIYQSSKGGHYYKNEERKDEQLTVQIEASLRGLEQEMAQRGGDLRTEEKKADRILADQESKRDLSQSIVVVDCDAFYASVEELDDPSLKGKAFGVGEGVLTTASYEARKFGCRSAMPGYIAKKLCPHLIFVKPDFSKYSAASAKVMAVLARYDPNFSPASLDEAYMNLTPYIRKTGLSPAEAVAQMREEVKRETGLTVSAGCGPNTMLAKIAADVNKPDGQCIIEPNAQACKDFMQDLSVRKIPGIGRVTERWLEALGVLKCKDIYTLRGKLILAKGETGSTWLLRSYLGIAGNHVEKGKREDRRGVGHETTFSTLYKLVDLDNKLKEIADSLGEDLTRLKYSGRTLTLKLKLESYEVLSRSKTIDGVTYTNAEQLYKYGKQMLDHEVAARARAYDEGKPIKGKGRELRLRLMGLKVSNLIDDSEDAAKKKTGLHKWATSAGSSKVKIEAKPDVPIDLTLLEDSEPEDEDDGFEEIFLEAAPCSVCFRTFPFENDAYNKHVAECIDKRDTIIDLSMSSQDLLEPDCKPDKRVLKLEDEQDPPKKKIKKGRTDRAGSSTSSNGSLLKEKTGKAQAKVGKDAFSKLMKSSDSSKKKQKTSK